MWIDLFNITSEERGVIKELLNIEVPTYKDISQIEISERLYIENGALFLTITELIYKGKGFPETQSVVFIVHNNCIDKFAKQPNNNGSAENILLILMRNMVTRLSYVVQSLSVEVDSYGRAILDSKNDRVDHTYLLKQIGQKGDLLSKSRECLFSLTMAVRYILKSALLCHCQIKRDQ